MEKANAKVQGLLKNKAALWALGGLGVLLLFNPLSWFGSGDAASPQMNSAPSGKTEAVVTNSSRAEMDSYEAAYEQRLQEILATVRGVADPSVMVTIDSSEEIVYAENSTSSKQDTRENDTKGGTRGVTQLDESGQLVMLKKNGAEQPIVVKTIKPRVRGVVVTAVGAEDIKVQALITEAVQRVLEVPPHKISILPKKNQ